MTSDQDDSTKRQEREAATSCRNALVRVRIALPHLAGLVARVRVQPEWRTATAGVFASGRIVVNPSFVLGLSSADLTFVMAHEVLHLALASHERGVGSDAWAVNVAHDYIINDILREELEQEIPADGLSWWGARHLSLEKLLAIIRQSSARDFPNWRITSPQAASQGSEGRPLSPIERAMVEAGLACEPPPPSAAEAGTQLAEAGTHLDVFDRLMEREWYPESGALEIDRHCDEIRSCVAKANSVGVLLDVMKEADGKGSGPGNCGAVVDSLQTSYRPAWELALQRWFDSQAPSERSFARPSRRGANRTDVVLPGRKRDGWTMHLVLDTSGSMIEELRIALGFIGSFCQSSAVTEVHILQCDVEVTADEWISPEQLDRYELRGFGGSDMSPAMHRLADDPQVEAAVVVTDGSIEYPHEEMPYHLLWAVIDSWWACYFQPSYGIVARLPCYPE